MTGLVQTFAAGLLALAGHTALVLIALRVRYPKSPMAAHVCSGLLGLTAVVGFSLLRGAGDDMWRSLALFAFGAALLLFAYAAIYKSISLRMLSESARSGSAISFTELAERTIHRSFDERIELLVGQGQAECANGGYRLTPAGMRMVEIIGKLRRFFSAETSGMYGPGREEI